MIPASTKRWTWLAYVVVTIGVLWFTAPLWQTSDRIFVGLLATDGVVTPWFYDFVARETAAGRDLALLEDFDFPKPLPMGSEFPSTMDAVIAAPISWFFGWPQRWGVIQSAAVLVNALSLAILARVMGLRFLGIVAAGVCAIFMRPMWSDMMLARMNVITPGWAILAMAFSLAAFPRDVLGRRRKYWKRGAAVLLASGFGAIAALVYPPFVLMVVPIGIVLAVPFLRHGGWFGWVLPVVSAGLAYYWCFDELWGIYSSNLRSAQCSDLTCPDQYHTVSWENMSVWSFVKGNGLSLSGIQGGAWLLAPLALLHRRWRWGGLLLILTALSMAFLSRGPCPDDLPFMHRGADWYAPFKPYLSTFWCHAKDIHDFGRFASIASITLVLCAALAVDAVRGKIQVLMVPLLGWVLFKTGAPLLSEILEPGRWHYMPKNIPAEFLADKRGAAVELPFDRSAQFLSAIQAPGVRRANPVRPTDPPRIMNNFYMWLFAVGRGQKTSLVVSEAEVNMSGLSWVIYDRSRCNNNGSTPRACESWVLEELTEKLGEYDELDGGVMVWTLR